MEFDYRNLYAPLDLGVARCRMAVAERRKWRAGDDPSRWSHVHVATKYPETTRRHFATRGVQAECIKLNGAMELAPALGLCRRIVRSGVVGAHAARERPRGGGEDRRHHLVPGGQPHGVEDAAGGARRVDRAFSRGGGCRRGLTRAEAGFADRFAAALAARCEDDAAAGREAAEDRRRGALPRRRRPARIHGALRRALPGRGGAPRGAAAARRGARGARRRDCGGAGARRGAYRGLSPRTDAA